MDKDRTGTHLFNPRIIYYTTYFLEVKGSKGKFSTKHLHNAHNIEVLLIIILFFLKKTLDIYVRLCYNIYIS